MGDTLFPPNFGIDLNSDETPHNLICRLVEHGPESVFGQPLAERVIEETRHLHESGYKALGPIFLPEKLFGRESAIAATGSYLQRLKERCGAMNVRLLPVLLTDKDEIDPVRIGVWVCITPVEPDGSPRPGSLRRRVLGRIAASRPL